MKPLKLALVLTLITPGLAQTRQPNPANAQLADPKIEARVDTLLRQMTLEEKLGQLVQYNDTGDSPTQPAATPKADQPQAKPGGVIVALNPVTANHIDSMQLAATGRLGSMLNTVGQSRTNTYQHLAVEKSRLHIPLLFGADILHGFRTIYPIPLGLAASFDPDLVTQLSASAGSTRPWSTSAATPAGAAPPRAPAKTPTSAQPWPAPTSRAIREKT